MVHASVFSGIGGPEVAAAMLGWENAFHCDINPFGVRVLNYWFPKAESYGDVKKQSFTKWGGELMSSQEDSPVSLFPMQESVEARMITATSGRKCLELYRKCGPLGSLVRTLVDSQRWSNPGVLLKWEMRPLFSERLTEFTDTNHETPSPLNESAVTLSQRDMMSSRLLFRLVPLEHRTAETGSSSLLITPTAVMAAQSPETQVARRERKGYKNGTTYGSLESQILYDPKCAKLLKTPCALDANADRRKSKGVSGTSGTLAQEIVSGYVRNRGLILPTPMTQGLKVCDSTGKSRFVNPALLPTPTAKEGTHGTNTYNPNSQMGQSLSAMAGSGLLPTPMARDYKNPSNADGDRIKRKVEQGYTIELNDLIPAITAEGMLPTPAARDWKGCTYGELLPDTISRLTKDSCPKTGGQTSRLSPLFTQEMMGFPLIYLIWPFLSRNGETEQSKPAETP